jgi:hypothetical protein
MPTKRIEVGIKATDWEKLYGLAQREKLSLQTVIDGILAAAIKVMEEDKK